MGNDRTSRWKHTDTHADLRAFLGDAAGLFSRAVAMPQRERRLTMLADQYGLSSTLAERAISALVLSHGDSHTAYELLAQWSLADSGGMPVANLANVALRPAPSDDQDTRGSEIELDLATTEANEVEAAPADQDVPETSPPPLNSLAHLSRQFARHVEERAAREGIHQLASEQAQRQLVAHAVRQYGLKPETARETMAELLPALERREAAEDTSAWHSSTPGQARASASPDTLPDLESILQDESNWLDQQELEAEQSDDPEGPVQSSRDAYRDYLDQRLTNIRGSRIDARQWKKLRDHGTVQFGLSGADVAHLIEERAHRRRMQVVTPARATDQLQSLVGSLHQRNKHLTPKLKGRLLTAGDQLGLEAAEARRIIERGAFVERTTSAPVRQQPNYRLLMAVSATAASVMLAFFLWVAVSQRPEEQPLASNSPGVEAEQDDRIHHMPPAPQWWDPQMVSAAEALAAEEVLLGELVRGMAEPVASRRLQATLSFYQAIDFSSPEFQAGQAEYRQLLVGYLVLEPERSAAVEAFRSIGDSIQTISAQWPATPETHAALFWRLDVLLRAVESPLISSQRAELFVKALNEVLNISANAADGLLAWREACTSALAQRCFDLLADSSARPAETILSAHQSLAAACGPFVPQAQVERLGSKLLCSLLRGGREWDTFGGVIQQHLDSQEVLNVLRFVAAYEQLPDCVTRENLGRALIARARLRTEPRTPEQTARVVRAALDHDNPEDRFVDRWEKFTFASERMLRRAEAASAEPALAQGILELAHQNLLGMALDLHEGKGRTMFDQYFIEGAPRLSPPRLAVASTNFTPSFEDRQRQEMPSHVAKELLRRTLLLLHSAPSREHDYHWEIAVRIIQRWEDLPPPVAQRLGQFVVSPLDAALETLVISDSQRLLAMPQFQLALAEALESSPLDDAALSARLSVLLGQQVALQDDEQGRARLRQALLESVYRDLDRSRTSDSPPQLPLAELRDQLTRLYQAKARLSNVSPGAYLTAGNPADMLAVLIEQEIEVERTSAGSANPWAAAELASVRYRSLSELEETVLLQRLWLKILAENISVEQPHNASRIASLLEQPESETDASRSLLSQLYWGEATELKLSLMRTALN